MGSPLSFFFGAATPCTVYRFLIRLDPMQSGPSHTCIIEVLHFDGSEKAYWLRVIHVFSGSREYFNRLRCSLRADLASSPEGSCFTFSARLVNLAVWRTAALDYLAAQQEEASEFA